MIFNDAECRWFYNAFASQIVSVLVDTKSMKITAKYTSEGALTDIKIEKANISEITAPIIPRQKRYSIGSHLKA